MRLKLTKKKILIFIPIIVTLITFSFWKPIANFAFESYLKNFCCTVLDGKLTADAIEYKDGLWVIKKPILEGNKSLEEGGLHISAEKVKVSIQPRLLEREINLTINIKGPNFNIKQASSNFKELINSYFSLPSRFFKVNTKVNVDSGSLYIHNFAVDPPVPQAIHFKLEADCQDEMKGCLVASLDDPFLKKNCVVLSLAQNDQRHLALDFNLENVECASLLGAVSTLLPNLLDLTITDGRLTGKMEVSFPKMGRPYATGELAINNLSFQAPSLEMRGEIKEAFLHLSENTSTRSSEGDQLTRTIGHFEFTKGGTFAFDREGMPFCEIKDLKGSAYFQTHDGARLAFAGKCEHHGQTSNLSIEGDARFAGSGESALDIKLKLGGGGNNDAAARFLTRQLNSKFKFAEIALNNIGPSEFDILNAIVAPHFPEIRQMHMAAGRMDASVLAHIRGWHVTNLKVEKIVATDLQFNLNPWEWTINLGALSGDLTIDLEAEKPFDSLNADLLVLNGQVCFGGFQREKCRLSDIQTKLTLRKGVIQQSLVEGEFAGLKGVIRLDGSSSDGEIMKLNFIGGTKGFASLLPETIRKGIRKGFSDDRIEIKANVRQSEKGMLVNGLLLVKASDSKAEYPIDFGFGMELASRQFWGKWPVSAEASSFWREVGVEACLAYLPSLAAPLAMLEAKWMEHELGMAGFVVRDGWFNAKQAPLQKFMASFLFPDSNVKILGMGDFSGNFNHMGMSVNYNLQNFSMENRALLMEIARLGKNGKGREEHAGTHYFDFITGTSYGTLSIKKASYLEKISGLGFLDISTDVTFIGKKVILENLETKCKGMEYAGRIEADLTHVVEDNFFVDIQVNDVKGTFSQLQNLFGHFERLKFLQKFPFEGDLALREKGASLHFDFHPGQSTFTSKVQGTASEGTVAYQNTSISGKNIKLNFDYDQDSKTLEFSDIIGTLVIGQGQQVEKYELAGDQISFTNLDRNEAEFDIWVGDSKRDIIRIVGKTLTEAHDEKAEFIKVEFDHNLTHFGDVHPTALELTLKNWFQIEYFQLELGLSLATVFQDLKTLSRAGAFFLPATIQKELNSVKDATGHFGIKLHYDEKSSIFSFHAIAENPKVGDYEFKKIMLHGAKKNSTWAIDQLILDDVSIAADLARLPLGWDVNFLGIRFGESLLLGLEGEYKDAENALTAKVNLMEINLSKLHEWPFLQKFVSEYYPNGYLRATGQLYFEMNPSMPKGWRLDTLVNGSLRSWEMKGLHFQDSSNVSFHLVSDRGMTIRQLNTSLKDDIDSETLGLLHAEKIEYILGKEEVIFDNLRFNIPAENISTTTANLQASFPEAFTPKVVEIICDLKRHKNLEGSFSMSKSPTETNVKVALNEGVYTFQGSEHDINNFVLSYDLKDLKILTQYRFQQQLFWLQAHTKAPSFDLGVISLAGYHPEQNIGAKEPAPLHIDWKIDPIYGFQVVKAVGHLNGLQVKMIEDPEVISSQEAIHLVGELDVTPQVAAKLVSTDLSTKLKEWQVGNGYRLKGRLRISKGDEAGHIHFHGVLQGFDFSVYGYQFKSMTAFVNYVPGCIEIRQLQLEDPAGMLSIKQASVYQGTDGEWMMAIPHVYISNFRPSLMQEVGAPPSTTWKPLLVKAMEIENLTGSCSNCETLKGTGKLYFVNPPKKNLQNTIFAIPAEILTMIGLDLNVLNPVSGTIFFDVKQGKFHLTKFKDVYSEGRLSKFNLCTVGGPSTVDFNGRLSIRIKMKQYNLFFKLAELFTVNIGGNLIKPTYSLQRQNSSKNFSKQTETVKKNV